MLGFIFVLYILGFFSSSQLVEPNGLQLPDSTVLMVLSAQQAADCLSLWVLVLHLVTHPLKWGSLAFQRPLLMEE